MLTERPPDLDRTENFVISVAGSPIDRISMRMRGVVGPGRNLRARTGFVAVGIMPLAGRAVLPLETHLILDTEHDPGAAELVWESTGFFRRERTGVSWTGGPLASAFGADDTLNRLAWEELTLDDELSVRPEAGRIRVVLRRDVVVEAGLLVPGLGRAHRVAWTPGMLELLERISAIARGWMG